jgi:hypothetical protein
MDQATEPDLLQHMEALLLANKVRTRRSEDKKDLKFGRLDGRDILRNTPSHWESAKVLDLLIALPRVGRVKALRWLNLEHISPERRLSNFTPRQRELLARHLDTYALRRDRLRRQFELSK